MDGSTLLTSIWLLPFLTGMLIVPVGRANHQLIKKISLTGSGFNLVLIIWLTLLFAARVSLAETGVDTRYTVLYFTLNVPWFSMLNIAYNIGVDGISVLMLLLTGIVIFCGVLASWELKEQAKEFFILLNVLVGGVYGVFVSFDLFTLFLFYEVAVLPMYLLIGIWGTGDKEYSAMKLTLMLVAGSALIFAGILAMYYESGIASFDILKLSRIRFPESLQVWGFPALFIGFGLLGGLFPFHTWSPDGHASAPTAVSMLHAGVLMKLGGYGCLRVAMYLMPEGAQMWVEFFLVLVTINIVYGAFGAIRQTDLKYITAYSSVSHCGLVLFGLLAMTYVGLKGAVLQMVSHGLMTALFFALIGMIYSRTRTRQIHEMGGLMKVMPFLSVAFVIAGLTGLGLPGLSGFVAEATIFIGSFANANPINRICTVLAVLSIVISAVYIIRSANFAINGPLNEKFNALSDATLVEKLPIAILVFLICGMGILPGWIINLVNSAIEPIVNNVMR